MKNKLDTAMVLAAGLGSRMRPLTNEMPKPLIRVRGKPLIDYALDKFAETGVTRAIVNVHYFADQIETHLAERTSPSIAISNEREALLETGGGLKKAIPLLRRSAVFCTNTDAILLDENDANACAVLKDKWDPLRMDALLMLVPIKKATGYDGAGDFHLGSDDRLTFRSGETAPFVFTGLQVISTDLVATGPDGAFSSKILWETALNKGRLFGCVHRGDWLHVGDPSGLQAAEARLTLHS